MNIQSFARALAVAALAATVVFPVRLSAQTNRPIRMIVASSAGSTIDVIARYVQATLAAELGAPLVIENIAGAGSIIAMQTLARANPDGSVVALQTNNMVTAPLLLKQAPYDAAKDFTPIAMVGVIPLAVVVNSSKIAATNPREFMALLKSDGSRLNYGSSGPGTILHLAIEKMQDEIGVKLNHIAYKGVAPMVNDLLGGQIDFVATSLPAVQSHIDRGTLRNVGWLTNNRVASYPDVPTFAEQGFHNLDTEVWLAVLGPQGMAAATVKRLHAAVLAAFNNPTVKQALEKQANIIKVSTPEEALNVIRQDAEKYAALAKKIKLTP